LSGISSAEVAVHLGDGKGTFAEVLSFPSVGRQNGGSFLIGDRNQDGKLDILVTRRDGWRVLLNTCQ